MVNKCLIFTSKTCKDCFALSNHYDDLKEQFPQIEFEYIDVNENPQIARNHKIYSVPAIELYVNNQLASELKHGNNLQYTHIVNFIKVQIELRKDNK